MNQLIKNNTTKILVNILLGAALLTIFTNSLLNLIYQNISPDFYFKINHIDIEEANKNPERIFNPCELVHLEMNRTALLDLAGDLTFVVTFEDIKQDKIHHSKVPTIGMKGTESTINGIQIPCLTEDGETLQDGEYRWTAAFTYSIHGYEKTSTGQTDLIHIKK